MGVFFIFSIFLVILVLALIHQRTGQAQSLRLVMPDMGEPSPFGMVSRVRTARRAGAGGVDLRKRRRWYADDDRDWETPEKY